MKGVYQLAFVEFGPMRFHVQNLVVRGSVLAQAVLTMAVCRLQDVTDFTPFYLICLALRRFLLCTPLLDQRVV